MSARSGWWRRLVGRRRSSPGQSRGAARPRPGATLDELDEEIRAHLEMRVEELVCRGMGPQEARAEAERRFGDLAVARRRLRATARRRDAAQRARQILESFLSDAVVAYRHARQAPGFTLLGLATFALGVGLTTATYTVVDRVLLRSLPYPAAEQLVALYSVNGAGNAFAYVSQGNWLDWKERSETLAATAIHSSAARATTVAADNDAFSVPAVQVSGPFFELLGNPVAAGRLFTEDESQADAAVAVVSEGFWQRVLGSDPQLRRSLLVEGQRLDVVGVVAAGKEYPAGTDLWLPYRHRRQTGGLRNNINWMAIARLSPGVTPEVARADLDRVAAWIRSTDPAGLYSWGVGVRPLKDHAVGGAGRSLVLLMGAVASVLLVACANLAGLGYARGAARTHETALRLALGAGRRRVVGQQVTEHVLLALAGGSMGILAAWGLTALFLASGDMPLPRANEVRVDAQILAAGVGICVLSGLLAGIAPALRASSATPRSAMGPGRGAVRGGGTLPGAVLVGVEVALAVVLLTGAGLLVRSFGALVGRDLGFVAENVLTADVALSAPRYFGEASFERRLAYWGAAIEIVVALPDVEAVAVANPAPAGDGRRGFLQIEDRPEIQGGADYRVVSDAYFRLLGIPFLEGRSFGPADVAGGERVAIVNRALATTHWPGESAVGRRIRATSMESPMGSPWLRIVGVVENVRSFGFQEETADETVYVLHRQVPYWTGSMTLLARTGGQGVARAAGVVRERLRELDPALAVELSTLEERLSAGVSAERLTMSVLGTFALLALGLASIGIFGLQSFGVVQRRREIAVRAALGATRTTIVGMVLRAAAGVAGVGAALGLLAAWWLNDVMAGLLVEVEPRDPVTFIAVAVVLIGASLLAAIVPAWRASRLDPLEALRAD